MFLLRIKLLNIVFFLLIQIGFILNSFAQMPHNHDDLTVKRRSKMQKNSEVQIGPAECLEMSIWDFSLGECRPVATAGMPMKMWMIHGNGFLVQNFTEGPRGRNEFSAPNMMMGDFGSTLGERQYLDVNIMLTFEKWTFPKRGYPELLQIGEEDKDDRPYVDGQHPHSSPVMGITLSDTITFENKKYLKLFFAPRGQATEGPVAFMHRPTGMINPDAPLGHHIGQDVSHITSTVLGGSLGVEKFRFEASIFNGSEPRPSNVDLPLAKLNSHAVRVIYQFSENFYAMTSASYVKNPEEHDPNVKENYRYSTSLYNDLNLNSGLIIHHCFIFGLVNYYDRFSKLRSFGDEFLLRDKDSPHNYWSRLELLERGTRELNILSTDQDSKWVGAITAGYTYEILLTDNGKMGIGLSVTKDFLPSVYKASYGGNPMTGKFFIQLMGMKMGENFR